jgi:hypothetical protein
VDLIGPKTGNREFFNRLHHYPKVALLLRGTGLRHTSRNLIGRHGI